MSDRPKRHVTVSLRMSRFELPPVESALIVGRKSSIGSNALVKALDEIMPGAFRRVEVQHSVVEAVVLRESDLGRIGAEKLVQLYVRHAEGMMEETEVLRVTSDLVIASTEEFEL
jgi:hypothetical protein